MLAETIDSAESFCQSQQVTIKHGNISLNRGAPFSKSVLLLTDEGKAVFRAE